MMPRPSSLKFPSLIDENMASLLDKVSHIDLQKIPIASRCQNCTAGSCTFPNYVSVNVSAHVQAEDGGAEDVVPM
jgi:hypothetical protein